ncbi:hypothetical protein MASR2M74_05190 [Paracoccaceae bacterium]
MIQAAHLPDGRLHLHYGPMDLICGAGAPRARVMAAGADPARGPIGGTALFQKGQSLTEEALRLEESEDV